MRSDVGKLFAEPVSAQDVPDYYDIITNPMDLGQVYDKLRKRKYESLDQVGADDRAVVWVTHEACQSVKSRNDGCWHMMATVIGTPQASPKIINKFQGYPKPFS